MAVTLGIILTICLIISFFQLIKSIITMCGTDTDLISAIIKQRDQQIKRANNLRVGLIITDLKMLYFSYLYFIQVKRQNKIQQIKQQLLSLGIKKQVVQNVYLLGKFVNKVDNNDIQVLFNDRNRTIQFKERQEEK